MAWQDEVNDDGVYLFRCGRCNQTFALKIDPEIVGTVEGQHGFAAVRMSRLATEHEAKHEAEHALNG